MTESGLDRHRAGDRGRRGAHGSAGMRYTLILFVLLLPLVAEKLPNL
jgi:hypothetical protein